MLGIVSCLGVFWLLTLVAMLYFSPTADTNPYAVLKNLNYSRLYRLLTVFCAMLLGQYFMTEASHFVIFNTGLAVIYMATSFIRYGTSL
jgi:hypothetical protein